MDLKPFRAHVYDEPGSSDGVVDISGIVSGQGSLSPRRLLDEDPAKVWTEWSSEGFLRQVPEPGVYLIRSGRAGGGKSIQSSAFIAWDSSVAPNSPVGTFHQAPPPNPALLELLTPAGMPLARATETDGTHHRVWPLTAGAVVETLCDAGQEFPSGADPLVLFSFGDILPPPGLVFLA